AAKRSAPKRGFGACGDRSVRGRLVGYVEVVFEVIVTGDVARELSAFELVGVGRQDGRLDLFPAHRVDWVRDVGVQLGSAVGIADGAVLIQAATALVAEPAPQVILRSAVVTTIGQLAGGHGDEKALGSFNDLEVADDKHVIEGDATEGLQSLIAARVVFHELDADFSDLHSQYSFTRRSLLKGR